MSCKSSCTNLRLSRPTGLYSRWINLLLAHFEVEAVGHLSQDCDSTSKSGRDANPEYSVIPAAQMQLDAVPRVRYISPLIACLCR